MRISDGSSDGCSSDLFPVHVFPVRKIGDLGNVRDYLETMIDALRKEAEAAAASSVFFRSGGQGQAATTVAQAAPGDRKSVVSGKSVSVRVDLGGRRIIKKKNIRQVSEQHCTTP